MDDCYEFGLIENDGGGYSDNEWETSFSNGVPLKTKPSSQKSFSAIVGVKLMVKPDVRVRDFEGVISQKSVLVTSLDFNSCRVTTYFYYKK